ncbi:MAG: type I glyceraldehyde-3-phosphate dehydrogenase [Bacteroidales bacterium]|nr:type I glyceraldehyde-3-phosphate dehydrogenase [Bacteroidales bacterium]
MAIKIGINGLGRIGKMVFRLACTSSEIEVVHLNDAMDISMLAHLLKYDSIHGKYSAEIEVEKGYLLVNNKRIPVSSERHPSTIPWELSGAEIVVESSGLFKTRSELNQHLRGSVKKVILTCPPGDDLIDRTIVMGVNHQQLLPSDRFVSNASCTTNCVALVLKVLNDSFGVKKAFMNTVHPYTNNQSILDGPNQDFRRARAAAVNLIPTTSSAIRSVSLVMPEMKNLFDGFATRVPVPDGSFVELTAVLNKKVTPPLVREVFQIAEKHQMKGFLEYCKDPVVSSDIINNSHSAIFDALSTKVIDGDFVQVLAWYDNEIGYSNRIIDLISYISRL